MSKASEHIRVSPDVKTRIEALGNAGESHNDVLDRELPEGDDGE